MFKSDEDGRYYDDSGILIPLADTPRDDKRRTPQGLKKEKLETKEEKELKYQYLKTLINGKPKNHKKPWEDKDIKEIIKEKDTIETRFEFAILLNRTPNAIEFIQAYAKREEPLYDWDKDHKDYVQIKRCQLELEQIDQEEYDEILRKPGREGRAKRLEKRRKNNANRRT